MGWFDDDYDRGYRSYGRGDWGRAMGWKRSPDDWAGPFHGGGWFGRAGFGERGRYASGGWYDRGFGVAPERSPTYGRSGDRSARRYARRRGYEVEYAIQPRGGGRAVSQEGRHGGSSRRGYDGFDRELGW